MKLFEAGSLWSYKGYRLFWFSSRIFLHNPTAFAYELFSRRTQVSAKTSP